MNKYINEYMKNRTKMDFSFSLIRNTRGRFHDALNGKSKSSSTRDILGTDINLYKKWIECQFTTETNWSNIESDHVKPIFLFNVSDDKEFRIASKWKNTQPLRKEVHSQKGVKSNFLD